MTAFTLPAAISACEQAISANEAAATDRVNRLILDGLTARLRAYLAAAEREQASALGSKHLFGANWRGPSLADILASSDLHRSDPVTVARRMIENKRGIAA